MKKGSFVNFLHRVKYMLEILSKQTDYPKTREYICEQWADYVHTDGIPMAEKKFFRTIDSIRENFGINIKHHCVDNEVVYYIANPEDLGGCEFLHWCISAYRIGNVLLNAGAVRDRIILEDFPSEHGHFDVIVDAIKAERKIQVEYLRYGALESKPHLLSPVFVKEYRGRLFAICITEFGHLCSFGLDRILGKIIITQEKFTMPNMSADKYFENAFGVYVDNKQFPPEIVELRVTKDEAYYLDDVPPHWSQMKIKEEDDFVYYKYFISPTNDFIGFLLNRGVRLKVMKPAWLAQEVRNRHLDAANLYDEG